MSVGSEPATSGSVIAKHDDAAPSHSGFRYFSFCSSVPQCSSVCMLPSSGACALIANGPKPGLGRLGLHHRELDVAEAHAAPLLRHVRQPEPPLLGRLAHLDDAVDQLVAILAVGHRPSPRWAHDRRDEVADLRPRISSSSGGKLKSMAMAAESATDLDRRVRSGPLAGSPAVPCAAMRSRYLTTERHPAVRGRGGHGPARAAAARLSRVRVLVAAPAPALGAAGFHAVAPDLPGYGRSDKPDVTYDCEWINARSSALVDALGHERVVIAGHDWGGLLVWIAAPVSRAHRRRDRREHARPAAPAAAADRVAADGVPGRAAVPRAVPGSRRGRVGARGGRPTTTSSR